MPVVTVPVGGEGESSMPEGQLCEPGNLQVAMTVLANGAAAGANRRTDAADQLSQNAQYSWTIAMQTPTNFAAYAMRTVNESGSSRTRAETNNPVNTAAPQ